MQEKKKNEEYEIDYDIVLEVRLQGSVTEEAPLDEMGIENIKQWFVDDMEKACIDTEVLRVKAISLKDQRY